MTRNAEIDFWTTALAVVATEKKEKKGGCPMVDSELGCRGHCRAGGLRTGTLLACFP